MCSVLPHVGLLWLAVIAKQDNAPGVGNGLEARGGLAMPLTDIKELTGKWMARGRLSLGIPRSGYRCRDLRGKIILVDDIMNVCKLCIDK